MSTISPSGFLALNINNEHTERVADLVRRQTDSRRVVHCLYHIVYEALNAIIDILTRSAF